MKKLYLNVNILSFASVVMILNILAQSGYPVTIFGLATVYLFLAERLRLPLQKREKKFKTTSKKKIIINTILTYLFLVGLCITYALSINILKSIFVFLYISAYLFLINNYIYALVEDEFDNPTDE